MKVICAWCKTQLREKEPFDDDAATHTICETCKVAFLADAKKLAS